MRSIIDYGRYTIDFMMLLKIKKIIQSQDLFFIINYKRTNIFIIIILTFKKLLGNQIKNTEVKFWFLRKISTVSMNKTLIFIFYQNYILNKFMNKYYS